MNITNIVKISKHGDECLNVYPEIHDPSYQHIYREAAGVHWNDKEACFYMCVSKDWIKEWDLKKCYAHIISIVNSIGIRMKQFPNTLFDSDIEHFKEEILVADREVQKWIDENTKTKPN